MMSTRVDIHILACPISVDSRITVEHGRELSPTGRLLQGLAFQAEASVPVDTLASRCEQHSDRSLILAPLQNHCRETLLLLDVNACSRAE